MDFNYEGFRGDVDFKTKYLNESLKNKILSDQDLIIRISLFNRIADLEEMFNKDFYNFNMDEVRTTLFTFGESTNLTLASKVSLLKEYANYALLEGKTIYSQPSISNFKNKDLYEFLSTSKSYLKYITKSELFENIEKLRNYQDKALLLLIFKGVLGHTYQDLINLKISDFNFKEKTLRFNHYYKPKGNKDQEVEIEEKLINLTDEEAFIIQAAIHEEVYVYPKDYKHKIDDETKHIQLENSNYILKKNNFKGNEETKVSYELIHFRLAWCKKIFKNNIIRPSSLNVSGFIYDLMQIKPDWTRKEFYDICLAPNINFSYKTLEDAYAVLKEKYENEKLELLE